MNCKFLILTSVAVLVASGCGHKNNDSETPSGPGLENPDVFAAAVVQQPINNLVEGLRLTLEPELRPYYPLEITQIADEAMRDCDVNTVLAQNNRSVAIHASAAHPNCKYEFSEKRITQGTIVLHRKLESVDLKLQVLDPATISATQLKELTVSDGRRAESSGPNGVLNGVADRFVGALTLADSSTTSITSVESLHVFFIAGTSSAKQSVTSVIVKKGQSAIVERNREIKEGELTSEAFKVNGNSVSISQAESLKTGTN